MRDPKLARLIEQLTSSTGTVSPEWHHRRAAALEAKIYQIETDAIAAAAARRQAEQETASAKAELAALKKSSTLQHTDHERELMHCRSQLAAKTEENAALERELSVS